MPPDPEYAFSFEDFCRWIQIDRERQGHDITISPTAAWPRDARQAREPARLLQHERIRTSDVSWQAVHLWAPRPASMHDQKLHDQDERACRLAVLAQALGSG